MNAPTDDWKEEAYAAYLANFERQNVRERQHRFERGEFVLELVASENDPPPRDPAFQQQLSSFGAELRAAGVAYSQKALALDAVDAHGYPLPEFILALQILAPPAMGAIGVAAGAWIQARYGRRARIKIGDVEAEGRTVEEVGALLEMAKAYRSVEATDAANAIKSANTASLAPPEGKL